MADPYPTIKAEVAKILMQEYISARQEVIAHVQLYKTQARSGAFLIPLTGFLIPLALGEKVQIPNTTIALDPNAWMSLAIIATISTVIFHMTFSILAIQFAIQILAERCVYLEGKINDCFDGKYLVWELVSHQIWSNKSPIALKNPDTFIIIFAFMVALFFGVILPLYALTKAFSIPHTEWFVLVSFAYTWCLFSAAAIAIHLTFYSTGSLRVECRQMFDSVLKKRAPLPTQPAVRSMLFTLSIATFVATIVQLSILWR